MRVTETGFRAVNASGDDRVLVIEHQGVGARSATLLPAGSEVSWPLGFDATSGVTLDVVTVEPRSVTHTGPMSIDLARTDGAPLFLHVAADHACAWAAAGGGILLGASAAVPLGTPAAASSSSGCGCNAASAAHVPVIPPMEGTGPQTPPRLDPEPLPPI